MFRKRVSYLQHTISFFVKANCGENRKITTNFLCDSTTHFLKNLPLVAFFILLFSVILLLPVVFFNWQPNYISEIDNRKLAEFPNLDKINSETFKDIYKYINDVYVLL